MAEVPDAAPDEGTPAAETEAPAVAADTAEPQEETAEQRADRERDERGRFVSTKPPEGETPEEAVERLYAGKYRTPEELEAAHQELQSVLGRQGQELGDLRSLIEERTRPPQQPAPAADSLQEQLYENPHQIIPVLQQAHQAALSGDANAATVRDVALATLRELNGAEAEKYSRWVVQTELAAQQQQVSLAETQRQTTWNQAAEAFAQTHPDINQLAPQMAELVERSPHIVGLLQSQDPSVRLEVLDYLYTKAKAAAGDTLSTVRETVTAQTVEETDRAIADAAVASATTTNPQDPNPTAEQQIQERMRKAIPFSFGDEWSFRS